MPPAPRGHQRQSVTNTGALSLGRPPDTRQAGPPTWHPGQTPSDPGAAALLQVRLRGMSGHLDARRPRGASAPVRQMLPARVAPGSRGDARKRTLIDAHAPAGAHARMHAHTRGRTRAHTCTHSRALTPPAPARSSRAPWGLSPPGPSRPAPRPSLRDPEAPQGTGFHGQIPPSAFRASGASAGSGRGVAEPLAPSGRSAGLRGRGYYPRTSSPHRSPRLRMGEKSGLPPAP